MEVSIGEGQQAGLVPAMLDEILSAGVFPCDGQIDVMGRGDFDAAFAVTDLAVAAIGAAGLAAAEFVHSIGGGSPSITVDRRLASFWFGSSIRPDGWTVPPPWDSIAGDYRAKDSWIRLHTNAPTHRSAALEVLGVDGEREAVEEAVGSWEAEALESAVVNAGGCAAAMYSEVDWNASLQGRAVRSEPLIHWETSGEAPALERPADRARPLAGLRVLDLTRVLAGPVGTRFLALLGADVLRIDPPDWDEPAVLPEVMLGKRSARLDLRESEDRRTFTSLLKDSDVLIHGYRPGALERLGFGSEALRELHPALIEVALDAYGWTGPWAGRRGFDSLVQMSSGIAHTGMQRFGDAAPHPLPVQALDHATGYIVAFAALQALTERVSHGRSPRARLSLARTAMLLTGYPLASSVPLEPQGPDDFTEGVEQTGWGPAKRLKSPLSLEGVPLYAKHPAAPLGSSLPRW